MFDDRHPAAHGRRESIDIPGFSHRHPIPAASRIGPFVMSGALTGRDPEAGEMPEGLDAQMANAFEHLRAVMRGAGGTVDDILKLNVRLVDGEDREALNREWTAMFPDPALRPARQVIPVSTLGGGALVHLDLVAVLGEWPHRG